MRADKIDDVIKILKKLIPSAYYKHLEIKTEDDGEWVEFTVYGDLVAFIDNDKRSFICSDSYLINMKKAELAGIAKDVSDQDRFAQILTE